MSRKSDDNIEKFFRKAVHQTDTSFRDHDWQQMNKMLDDQAVTATRGRMTSGKRIAGAVTGVVMVALIVYFFLNNGKTIDEKQYASQQQAAAGKGALDDENRNPAASPLLTEPGNTNETPALTSKEKSATESSSGSAVRSREKSTATADAKQAVTKSANADATVKESTAQLAIKEKSAATSSSHRTTTTTKQEADQAINANQKSTQQQTVNQDAASKEAPAIGATSPSREEQVSSPALAESKDAPSKNSELISADPVLRTASSASGEALEQKQNPAGAEDIAKNSNSLSTTQATANQETANKDSIATEETLATENILAGEKEKNKEAARRAWSSRWNVALVVAPDFSSTSFDKMTAPGGAFGLLAGYRVFNRITINAGVIRSSKKYDSYGEDYQPPYGYWKARTNGVVPDKIKGQCAIIEFPLLVQYDVVQRAKSRLYVSGGVSSYRMLSESYHYTFDQPNAGADESWSSSRPSSYLFKVGHFSLAYERIIARGFSLGIEPYVKVPFQGIGWSKVDLYTTGVYANVRYRF